MINEERKILFTYEEIRELHRQVRERLQKISETMTPRKIFLDKLDDYGKKYVKDPLTYVKKVENLIGHDPSKIEAAYFEIKKIYPIPTVEFKVEPLKSLFAFQKKASHYEITPQEYYNNLKKLGKSYPELKGFLDNLAEDYINRPSALKKLREEGNYSENKIRSKIVTQVNENPELEQLIASSLEESFNFSIENKQFNNEKELIKEIESYNVFPEKKVLNTVLNNLKKDSFERENHSLNVKEKIADIQKFYEADNNEMKISGYNYIDFLEKEIVKLKKCLNDNSENIKFVSEKILKTYEKENKNNKIPNEIFRTHIFSLAKKFPNLEEKVTKILLNSLSEDYKKKEITVEKYKNEIEKMEKEFLTQESESKIKIEKSNLKDIFQENNFENNLNETLSLLKSKQISEKEFREEIESLLPSFQENKENICEELKKSFKREFPNEKNYRKELCKFANNSEEFIQQNFSKEILENLLNEIEINPNKETQEKLNKRFKDTMKTFTNLFPKQKAFFEKETEKFFNLQKQNENSNNKKQKENSNNNEKVKTSKR
jgi:hypothetical protein